MPGQPVKTGLDYGFGFRARDKNAGAHLQVEVAERRVAGDVLDNNSIVHFPGTEDMIGNIYNVKLDECRGFYYMGEIKEDA